MATSSAPLFIGLGTPVVATPSITIVSVGQQGDPAAKRILTHPDSANFSPIAYYKNPDFTTNLDNTVLTFPDGKLVKTSTSSQLIRQEGVLADVVCEETWGAQEGRRASMPTFLFRQLYEYLINPPPFDATAQEYIQWQPRDRTALTYNVHLFKLTVGGGSGTRTFNVKEYRGQQGPIQSPFEGLDVSPTGFIDQSVTAHLHIVSQVT
ncbi:MAG: hypothetical protein WBG86_06300 [Polyangiales bacterium]